MARFLFFLFKTRFGPCSNPFLPRFFSRCCPFLFPFLSHSCSAYLSYLICTTSSPTIGPRRTITRPRNQWEVCICGEETLKTSLCDMFAPACGSKQNSRVKKAIGQGAPIAKKKRRLNGPDDRRGWPSSVGCHPSCLRRPTNQTRQLSILVNGRRLCQPQFGSCRAQAQRTVCTGNPSYRSGSKGVKSVILGQRLNSPLPLKQKGLAPMRYQLRFSGSAGNRVMSTHCGVVVGCQTPFLGGDQSSHCPSVEPARFSV